MNIKKKVVLLGLGLISTVISSCSQQYQYGAINSIILNYKQISALQKELNELKKLHGDRCAPKELAYADVYLEALKGLKSYETASSFFYRRIKVSDSQRIKYFTYAKEYLSVAREKIYGDKDGDGLPCYVEVDIGTNPNIPDTKAFDRRKIEAIRRKLLAKKLNKRKKIDNGKSNISENYDTGNYKPLKLTARIHFDLNKATIKRSYLPYLNVIVRYLKAHPELKIKIIGYTDNIGSKKYNDRLAYKRALAIKNYLVNHGINSSRIVIVGKGKTEYLVENNTEIDRFTNRRAEFFVMRATD